MDLAVDHGDLPVVDLEEVPDDSMRMVQAFASSRLSSWAVPAGPQSSPTTGRMPFFAMTPWIWALALVRWPTSENRGGVGCNVWMIDSSNELGPRRRSQSDVRDDDPLIVCSVERVAPRYRSNKRGIDCCHS